MLIFRYLNREILRPLATICVILGVIFAGYSVTRYLPDAANGMMTGTTVVVLVFLKVLIALEVLIPITLFLSIVTVLGRMHTESEIIAMEACGLGERTLVWSVLKVSLLISVLVAGLSLHARPWAYEKSYWLKANAEENFDFARLRPGRFHEFGVSRHVVFLESIDGQRERAKGVFIQQRDGQIRKITHAREAWQELDPETANKTLVLQDGYHYEIAENGVETVLARFQEFRLPLVPKQIDSTEYRLKAASTQSLAASSSPEAEAEFQWRISTTLSTVLLGLLGIPLGRTAPRRGKTTKTFLAVIVFAGYYNMTVIAKTWVEQGVVSGFPGIWWPQIILAVLLIVLLKRPHSSKVMR